MFSPNLLEGINEGQGKLIKSATVYKQEKFLLLCELLVNVVRKPGNSPPCL